MFAAAVQSTCATIPSTQLAAASTSTQSAAAVFAAAVQASKPSEQVQAQQAPPLRLVWVKLKGFPMWPAHILKNLELDNLVEIACFDKRETKLIVDLKDTSSFCRREDLKKRINIPAKYKNDWNAGYQKCVNLFMEIS